MDPLTLLAAAKVSFEALKAGIAVGKELQGMAKDLGSLFESVAAITRVAADPRSSLMAGKSAQQIAMEAYAAKAEAESMMADLKNHFVGEFGLAAWDQVIAATTKIKKDQKAAALQAEKDHEEFMNNVAGVMLVVIAIGVVMLIILFFLYLLLNR
jgi:hypothetical protein